MDRRWSWTRVRGGDSSLDDLPVTEEQHSHQSDGKSGLKRQAASRRGSSGIVITTMEELSNAIRSSNMSKVTRISLVGQDIARGGLAMALATCQMPALEELVVRDIRRVNALGELVPGEFLSEAVIKALSRGNFPTLMSIDFGRNTAGPGGIEALTCAIESGKLKRLERLSLSNTGIDDDAMGKLATAFLHGQASVLPYLRHLNLGRNRFTDVGLKSMAKALESGRLDSLESLCLYESPDPSQAGEASIPSEENKTPDPPQAGEASNPSEEHEAPNFSEEGAKAIVSALALNRSLAVDVEFEWDRFPDLQRQQNQLRERNFRHKGSSMVPAAFGSIYLCGDGKVGKTTLCNTLQRTFWQSQWTTNQRPHVTRGIDAGNDVSKLSSKGSRRREENPIAPLVQSKFWQSLWTTKRTPHVTRGIDVSKIFSKGSKRKKEKPIMLFVHDLAEQQISPLMRSAFFPAVCLSKDNKATTSTATIFVVVCNSERTRDEVEQQLDQWLCYIKSNYHESTKQIGDVFVVLNSMGKDKDVQRDYQYLPELLKKMRAKFTGSLDVLAKSFVLDVRRIGEVKSLKTCLLEHSRTLLRGHEIPEICDKIRRRLPIWSETKKEFPVLHWEEFLHEAEKLSGKGREQLVLLATEYLNEVGALIYIEKPPFSTQSGILYRRLIVLDPNWFWYEVIGNIFLSEDRGNGREVDDELKSKWNPRPGFLSMSDFKSFLESRWSPEDCDDLIAILLWGKLCDMVNEKVRIPSLIDKTVDAEDQWQSRSASTVKDGKEQWVMGFSVEHQKNRSTRAPMALWRRFEDVLKENPNYGGDVLVTDNDFVADKYFMSFTVDYMNVRIEVDAEMDSPTFEQISIFVKPLFSEDELGINQRKQCQIDLADDLVNILLRLWKEICVEVEYVLKVVWPWPVSQSRLVNPDRNVEVEEWVRKYRIGHIMEWRVGSGSEITEDQLLSTNRKPSVVQ